MLQAFFDSILPIFAVLAVGFALCKMAIFDAAHASAMNRFVFYLAAPALIFAIFARAPLDQLNLPVLASYLAAEVIIYSSVAVLARRLFHLPLAESLLLGMTAIFSNHVFFVRPIAILVYGESVVLPIGGIIVIDILAFCATVFMVDAVTSGSTQIKAAAIGLLRNPFVVSPVMGVLAWFFSGRASRPSSPAPRSASRSRPLRSRRASAHRSCRTTRRSTRRSWRRRWRSTSHAAFS